MEFVCKQFSLNHSKSTMKIGTDAILLSALSPNISPKNVLEIGTGCGIIALCMAQKYNNAQITAIDIDHNSIEEAKDNFSRSKYNERLFAKEIDIQKFSKNSTEKYDLIISNPPFFVSSLESPFAKRNKARHTSTLCFEDLAFASKNLISDNGILAIILPSKEAKIFENIAIKENLHPIERIKIFSRPIKDFQRVILHFKKLNFNDIALNEKYKTIVEREIIIRDNNNNFTQEYNSLVKEFLL